MALYDSLPAVLVLKILLPQAFQRKVVTVEPTLAPLSSR